MNGGQPHCSASPASLVEEGQEVCVYFQKCLEAEYHHIINATGETAISSMCILNIKKDVDSDPSWAKSQIVVLGNKDPTQ